MTLKLLSRQILLNIPSASGIEIYNHNYYIIGDDSAWLFILDNTLNLVEKIPLLKKEKLSETAIEKKKKPDFEAMTFARADNEEVLFIFGSGSKPIKRDKLVIVFPEKQHTVERFSLEEFYNVLREKEIGEGHKLNIEAAAADNNKLYLFHRGNISGKNLVFTFPLYDFADYVFERTKNVPDYTVTNYVLPYLNGIAAGFSGASILDEKRILFSASVENTANEIDDGAILGSFIGIINQQEKTVGCEVISQNNQIVPVKIESVCLKQTTGNIHTLLAVTDSDGGASEVLEIELTE